MSLPMRGLLSAFLALVFVVLLTAPLHGAVDELSPAPETSSEDVVQKDAIKADRSGQHAPFIKPQAAAPVIAERGVDHTEFIQSSLTSHSRLSDSESADVQVPVEELDSRRALLRVYRL